MVRPRPWFSQGWWLLTHLGPVDFCHGFGFCWTPSSRCRLSQRVSPGVCSSVCLRVVCVSVLVRLVAVVWCLRHPLPLGQLVFGLKSV